VTFAGVVGLDYGAIDLVADDDHAYITDVNPTAWGGQITPVFRKHLRRGLRRWRPASQRAITSA
jgi:glutathione synthase/RimK-type ligase-like ATP-grasp enzyme